MHIDIYTFTVRMVVLLPARRLSPYSLLSDSILVLVISWYRARWLKASF